MSSVNLEDISSGYLIFPHFNLSQVLNGHPYNRKCDVYSFGICLWEIYCCDMPYPNLSFSELTSAVVHQVDKNLSLLCECVCVRTCVLHHVCNSVKLNTVIVSNYQD